MRVASIYAQKIHPAIFLHTKSAWFQMAHSLSAGFL